MLQLQGQAALQGAQQPGPAAVNAASADESMAVDIDNGAEADVSSGLEHWRETINVALATPLPTNYTLRGVRSPNERNASFSISVRLACLPAALP